MSQRTRFIINAVSAVFAVIPLLWLFATLPTLPDVIPAHFGFSGTPDRWGSKYELLMVGIMPPLILLVCVISQHIDSANLPPRFSTHEQRSNATAVIGLVAVIILDIVSWYLISLVLGNL